MDSLPIVPAIAGAATLLMVFTTVFTLWARRSVNIAGQHSGTIWKRAFHLGAEIAGGRAIDRNSDSLAELIEETSEPILVATALAVAVRQEAGRVSPALYTTVGRSRLPTLLSKQLSSDDPNTIIEALEIIEVLQIYELLGDAATLTRQSAPRVVRAACDAVVEIDPSIGIGILIGLADNGDSWVLDSLGRAAAKLEAREDRTIPLSRAHWDSAPMLAQRALLESHSFDRATLAGAVASLIGALEADAAPKRLASVTALSVCIEHPAAQLALAGALGANDRMTRFAAAANLMDSVTGRGILRRAAAQEDESDATKMAAEILWPCDDRGTAPLKLVKA